jgi:hypothetical protein
MPPFPLAQLTMLSSARKLLRRIWRRSDRRAIDPSLVTPPSPAAREFRQRFRDNLAGCDWQPHPQYSVFTQYDASFYKRQEAAFLHKYRCFWAVSRTIRPKRLIELGTNAGSGADAYLSASPQAEYIGIDRFAEGAIRSELTGEFWHPYSIAETLLRSRGFSFRLIRANLRDLRELPDRADMVVVDAAHDFENEYADLRLALSANPDWIFVDDVIDPENAGAAVARFLERDVAGRLEFTVPIEYIGGGLVIRLKEKTG